MSSISETVHQKRVIENIRELKRGEVIRGQYCDVYYFRDPSEFTEVYQIGIRIFDGNLTYMASDMSNTQVNEFFAKSFQDTPEFFGSSAFCELFMFVGDDCNFATTVVNLGV